VRLGGRSCCTLADPDFGRDVAMLKFAPSQWQAVEAQLDAHYLDTVVRSLQQNTDLFEETHPVVVRRLANTGLARARTYGLEDACQLAQFVHLMAEVSSVFDLHPDISARLDDPALPPGERFSLLLAEADDGLWLAAGADDSLSGWYLDDPCRALRLPERWALALGNALHPEDLPPPLQRVDTVAAAITDAAAHGCTSADGQFIWAACACAYGPGFQRAMPWSGDVFAQSRPTELVTGMLRARLAIDFAAWL